MNFKDLTHTICQDMPVYPGTEQPLITNPCTLEKNGFREKKLAVYSHTGTHIDSPAHLLENGTSLDKLPPEHFYGQAIVLDVSGLAGEEIFLNDINCFKNQIQDLDFVIFYTGWYHKWGKPDYFSGFPVPALEVADYLVSCGIKGVGMDTISIDHIHTTDYKIHKTLLSNNIIIIENLTNLQNLAEKIFTIACFPLKILDTDGSPVRAIAIYDD